MGMDDAHDEHGNHMDMDIWVAWIYGVGFIHDINSHARVQRAKPKLINIHACHVTCQFLKNY